MTYLLFCSEHAYNLLVSEGTLVTANRPGRVPALVSSLPGGPWGHLARSPGHQRCSVLDEPLSYRLWTGSLQTGDMHTNERTQRQAEDHSGGVGGWEGDPRGESNGCASLRGQQHARSGDKNMSDQLACAQGGGDRQSAAWRLGREAEETMLYSAFCQALWEPASSTWASGATLEKPNPHIFLIGFCNILYQKNPNSVNNPDIHFYKKEFWRINHLY